MRPKTALWIPLLALLVLVLATLTCGSGQSQDRGGTLAAKSVAIPVATATPQPTAAPPPTATAEQSATPMLQPSLTPEHTLTPEPSLTFAEAPTGTPVPLLTDTLAPLPTNTPPPTPAPTDVLAPAAAAAELGAANVVIHAIFYDGKLRRVESDKYAEIANQGSAPVDIEGWRLNAGAPGQDFTFPAYVLQPGQACRVYTSESHPESCGFSVRSEKPLWNNDGDCGRLYDANGGMVGSIAISEAWIVGGLHVAVAAANGTVVETMQAPA